MSNIHLAYLSLGSNIQPESNLVGAVQMLRQHGELLKTSNAWESRSVGAPGPNYLNACLSLGTSLSQAQLKEQVLLPIETELGRQRSTDRFAPRTMDIDIVLFDEHLCDPKYWEQAFVIIPLAEIHPDYKNPATQESIVKTATRLRQGFWMEARGGVLSQFAGSSSSKA